MNKHLIINKLNKCKAYEFNQNFKSLEEDSTSKISTSTTTQQSPVPHNLNPQFTFKATDLKEIFLPKPKAQQFFQNFNPINDVIYQKAVLIKPKSLQRSLQFELLSMYRQSQIEQRNFMGRKLEFCENQKPVVSTQNIQVRQSNYRFSEFVKTQYNESKYTEQKEQDQYREYFQNIPYDCKKYKLSRQKLPFKQLSNVFDPHKRCQTQTNELYAYEPLQSKPFVTYQSQQTQKDDFDDYHFVKKEFQKNNLQTFNDYYVNSNLNLQSRENKNFTERNQENQMNQLSKRSGNSSRLSFFRKQRQQNFRKSLLQEFSNNNNSKRTNFCSNQNKQNIRSNTKFVPSLAFNNLSQAAQRRLKNQYSQRFLLGRRHLQQPLQSSKITLQPKGSVNYLNKETQSRIQSIRKQLREIYQVKDKEKSKLKIMRDQQTYQNNAKNSLRRVGSICKF